MSRHSDEFGDRMKAYEAVETKRALDPSLPIYARIDGRSFSSFTRGMGRPFDAAMTDAMIETTKHLCQESHALIGYTQSDEISLIWLGQHQGSQAFFGGKIQKTASILASMAAAKFARVCPAGYEDRLPHFDCRVLQLPSKDEAANALLWRAMDARKNAISMVAQSLFSHKQLHMVGQAGMLEMIKDAGIDFESYPDRFKRGTFVRRTNVMRTLTEAEMLSIPEAHRPLEPVLRSEMQVIEMPQFNRVSNRVGVIFDAEQPIERGSP